jgi:hypothetical protein
MYAGKEGIPKEGFQNRTTKMNEREKARDWRRLGVERMYQNVTKEQQGGTVNTRRRLESHHMMVNKVEKMRRENAKDTKKEKHQG